MKTSRKWNMRTVAYDCRYFLGDRPCVWHKQQGVLCQCEHYEPLRQSLLIIKLDAVGDVLRTTCLLPVISKAWPGVRIDWLTRPESVPLLDNNPYLTEILPYGAEALLHLSARRFDRVINLDAGKTSAALASMARANDKIGYLLHEDGYVTGTNRAAEEWLQLGVFDDLKKTNQRTYQDMMCAIVGLPADGMHYVLELTESEIKTGRDKLQGLGLDLSKPVVGIHTGGGGRWPLKQWHESRFLQLVTELAGQHQILLFGGPLEREQNKRIRQNAGSRLFDAGCDNGLREFAGLVQHCTVMLSGDSLAMHIALALKKRVVVLFGPTSHSEIELFGRGEKIFPEMDCLCCYKRSCDFKPNCMDLIAVERVREAVLRQLELSAMS